MLKKFNRKIAAGVAAVSLAVIGGGAAYAATDPGSHQFQQVACVKFGTPGSANGNVMEYDWNDTACPPGTYTVKLAQVPDTDPTATATVTVTPSPSGSSSGSASPSASHS